MTDRGERADRFRALHQGPSILVLPNAWDVASARLLESVGFGAVATTSAAVAWALGAPDGQHVSRDEMVAAVGRIAGALQVPVTADMEAGFGATPAEVAETIRLVVAAGAVGVNLEDGTRDPDRPLLPAKEQASRLRAARAAAGDSGVPLFINARTDVYLRQVGDPAGRLDHALERARAYLEAGADGIFVPGIADLEPIANLARAIPAPLNVLLIDSTPPVAELARAGVARLSTGPRPAQAVLGLLKQIGEELLEHGTYDAIRRFALPFGEVQALFG